MGECIFGGFQKVFQVIVRINGNGTEFGKKIVANLHTRVVFMSKTV